MYIVLANSMLLARRARATGTACVGSAREMYLKPELSRDVTLFDECGVEAGVASARVEMLPSRTCGIGYTKSMIPGRSYT